MTAPQPARRVARPSSALDVAEYFAPQRTATEALPDPEPLLANLTIGVLEVLAGVREADQLARWLGEDAFRALVTRANLSARARSARGVSPARPSYRIVSTHSSSPADGVIEGVVITAGPARTRAVAIRLEGWDGRWRATSLAAL
ncbi:MAG: 3-hydroxyacyl-CoA dehydrogenase [Microbacterium sp. SCN 70-27]|uniref:Rv3235 family protein n=1 Tax=unclassified Microbacterium TaxID=2609290 RepID=UPI00086DAF7B|nr:MULTISPECIES: Rv3235 family protein [unclassified Microbacterium]MBN9224651.1 3-hydroxyacyl-CoA dehydrogenase [Microbacterium sp.]ODT29042.1 MAG: 3-hydroxyacyl-CoA dehydrogenase [Microbacterium sp. SCN 70-27]